MFFDPELAFAALPELEPRTRSLLERLLPGGITALLPNPLRRYPLACGREGATPHARPARAGARRGDRRARGDALAGHAELGEPRRRDRRARLDEVPEGIRRGADLVLDGGELAGTPSTVVDLRRFELDGMWAVLRQGAVPEREIELAAAEAWSPVWPGPVVRSGAPLEPGARR